jgi:glyoxylase-like metal-dependent hydrolase (beta-lactamase superfamily II)
MDVIVDKPQIKIIRLTLGQWDTNSYIIIDPQTAQSAVIDVPAGAPTIGKYLKDTKLEWILLTHSHEDHIGGLKALRSKRLAAFALHKADKQPWLPIKADMEINDGDTLFIGKIALQVLHTPGHTPGSMCFLTDKYLFAGDTLFPGGPGHTDTPEEFQTILKSITEKLLVLPDNVNVYPGHGPSTTIKKAKKEYAAFATRQPDAALCGDVTWQR